MLTCGRCCMLASLQVRLQEEVERWLSVLPEWAEKEEALMAKVKDSLTELALELLPEVVPQADTIEQVRCAIPRHVDDSLRA